MPYTSSMRDEGEVHGKSYDELLEGGISATPEVFENPGFLESEMARHKTSLDFLKEKMKKLTGKEEVFLKIPVIISSQESDQM